MKKLLFIIIIVIVILIGLNFGNIKRYALKKVYTVQYSEYVELYAQEYNVDKNLIYAVIKAESNFDTKAESHKGAKGLMQLMYPTAQDVAKELKITIDEESIIDPKVNINIGTKYISNLIGKYGNIGVALAAYNAGSGNVDSWILNNTIQKDGSDIENIPYKETNNYVRKILRDYNIYKEIYD